MNLNKLLFQDASKEIWDSYVSRIDHATYAHSYFWVNYLEKFPFVEKNSSFLLLDDNQEIMAVCIMAFSNTPEGRFLSFSGTPCVTPIVSIAIPESHRRKVYLALSEEIERFCTENSIIRINLTLPPIQNQISGKFSQSRDLFKLIDWGFHYYAQNSLVLDLSLGEQKLNENLNKFHRKHVRKTASQGVQVGIFNLNSERKKISSLFEKFLQEHIASAGRLTRPIATWEAMQQAVFEGQATLFVSLFNEEPVSFLLCGHFGKSAFGWSQVNVEKFERELSPRHHLEWTAISHFANNGFETYEIGERYLEKQLMHSPTEKEISIAEFKERFGAMLLPRIYWIKFKDEEAEKNFFQEKMNFFFAKI